MVYLVHQKELHLRQYSFMFVPVDIIDHLELWVGIEVWKGRSTNFLLGCPIFRTVTNLWARAGKQGTMTYSSYTRRCWEKQVSNFRKDAYISVAAFASPHGLWPKTTVSPVISQPRMMSKKIRYFPREGKLHFIPMGSNFATQSWNLSEHRAWNTTWGMKKTDLKKSKNLCGRNIDALSRLCSNFVLVQHPNYA